MRLSITRLIGFLIGCVVIAQVVSSIIPNPSWVFGITGTISMVFGFLYSKYIGFRKPVVAVATNKLLKERNISQKEYDDIHDAVMREYTKHLDEIKRRGTYTPRYTSATKQFLK